MKFRELHITCRKIGAHFYIVILDNATFHMGKYLHRFSHMESREFMFHIENLIPIVIFEKRSSYFGSKSAHIISYTKFKIPDVM